MQDTKHYKITYSNYFNFEGKIYAFRQKMLFCISLVPAFIPFNEKSNSWLIGRKQLTKSKAKELLIHEEKIVDVSNLNWDKQIELDYCFNL